MKLSDYGMTHGKSTDGKRDTALYQPLEAFKGKREMKSDVWSLGIVLMEMMGTTPYCPYRRDFFPTSSICFEYPFDDDVIDSGELIDFLEKCFQKSKYDRWSVNELMDVSVMKWE